MTQRRHYTQRASDVLASALSGRHLMRLGSIRRIYPDIVGPGLAAVSSIKAERGRTLFIAATNAQVVRSLRELEGFIVKTVAERVDGAAPVAVHYAIDPRGVAAAVLERKANPPPPRVTGERREQWEQESRRIKDSDVRRELLEWMCLAMAGDREDER